MEPYYNLDVHCAESMMGDVIGDLNTKRGRILGMQSMDDGMSCVKAQVPYAEISEYAVDLRALTQGLGTFEIVITSYSIHYTKLYEIHCSRGIRFGRPQVQRSVFMSSDMKCFHVGIHAAAPGPARCGGRDSCCQKQWN